MPCGPCCCKSREGTAHVFHWHGRGAHRVTCRSRRRHALRYPISPWAPHEFDHLSATRPPWWLVFAATIGSFVTGSIGFSQLSQEHGGAADDSLAAAFYSALQMFGLHASHLQTTNRWVEFGRWSGVLTLPATIWFVLGKRLRREILKFRRRLWTGYTISHRCVTNDSPTIRQRTTDEQPPSNRRKNWLPDMFDSTNFSPQFRTHKWRFYRFFPRC